MSVSLDKLRFAFEVLVAVLAGLALFVPGVGAQTVTLNLKEADIRALVSTVADVTGKNFIVDPRVKGKVTVISGGPIQEKELYPLFLSVLSVHGFSTVPAGDAVKIVPAASGKSDSTPLATDTIPGKGDELVTRVVPVENVPAAQLVPILRPLVPQTGHLAAYPGSNVLIISDSAANVARLVNIIKRIDVTGEAEVELISLQHASAQEVVRILTSLLPPKAKGAPTEAPTRFVADERTNSVLVSGDNESRLRLRAIIAHLDTPMEVTGNTHVVYLRYAQAKDLVPILEGVTRSGPRGKDGAGAPTAGGGEVSIQADENMNALVITAPPDTIASLKAVIRQLDIRRAQVLLEGVIAEVRADKARQLGVQWQVSPKEADDRGAIGVTNFTTGGSSILAVSTNPAEAVGTGLSLGYLSGKTSIFGEDFLNISVLIQALASDSESNILATPTVVTLDNEEAEFIVAENVPILTGTFTTTTSGADNPFQTVERQDVGLTLRVKPQINEGNTVKLDIEQELSDVLPGATLAADNVVFSKRSIKTSVLVEDNTMLVLSGLLEDELSETSQKVPGLGNIPILGYLFKSQETQKAKNNLMFFLRPHILRDVVSAGAVSGNKYTYLRAQQLDAYREGVALMPDSEAPLLLELQDYLDAPPGTPAVGKPTRELLDSLDRQ